MQRLQSSKSVFVTNTIPPACACAGVIKNAGAWPAGRAVPSFHVILAQTISRHDALCKVTAVRYDSQAVSRMLKPTQI